CGQPPVVRAEPHGLVDLRGQDDLVAAPAAPQPTPDDLLRDPVAHGHVGGLWTAVDISGVEVVDAALDRRVQDGEAARLVQQIAEVHCAQSDPAHQQAGPPEVRV